MTGLEQGQFGRERTEQLRQGIDVKENMCKLSHQTSSQSHLLQASLPMGDGSLDHCQWLGQHQWWGTPPRHGVHLTFLKANKQMPPWNLNTQMSSVKRLSWRLQSQSLKSQGWLCSFGPLSLEMGTRVNQKHLHVWAALVLTFPSRCVFALAFPEKTLQKLSQIKSCFYVSCFFPKDFRQKKKEDIFNASCVLSGRTEQEL